MAYRLLADLVAAVHLLVVGFLVVGGPLCLRAPRLLRLHLPVAAAVLAVNLAHAACPLTVLEAGLRRLGGAPASGPGFLAHYVVHPLHPAGITPDVRVAMYAIAVTPTVVSYALLLLRARRRAVV